MPDIVLYIGEANPNDIRLRDTTGQSVALAGSQVACLSGIVKADWHITAQAGQPLVQMDVPVNGLASTSAQGNVSADSNRTQALSGLETVSGLGAVVPSSTRAVTGAESLSGSGLLHGDHDVAGAGLSSTPAHGLLVAAATGDLSGIASVSAFGTLAVTSLRDLSGLESISGTGVVGVSGPTGAALVGQAVVTALGTLTASGGAGSDANELIEIQRQRRFGRQYRTLVRSPYRSTVR